MQPIRKTRTIHVVQEPWGLGESVAGLEEVVHALTETGELTSNTVERQTAFDCGCLNNPVAGVCVDCLAEGFRGLTCAACFGHCICGRPICQSHSGYMWYEGQEPIRLCRSCFEAERRHLTFEKIRRFLLALP